MKKIFSILLIFMGSFLQAQEYYWSSYNITVADQDIETVARTDGCLFQSRRK